MNEEMKKAMDELKKTIAEANKLFAEKLADSEEKARKLISDAIKNHPGLTPQKFIPPANKSISVKDMILEQQPKEVQEQMDNIFILSKLLERPARSLKSWVKLENMAPDFVKAMDTQTAGEGLEWIPTGFSPTLLEKVRLATKVAGLFTIIPMPTNPYTLPVQLGRFTTYKHDEQTADTGQTKIPIGQAANEPTGKTTFTAQGHASRILVSKDIEEDSIIPILPFVQSELVKAMAEGREDAILNGDTAGTHEDSDVTSASDRRKLWLGLRAIANDRTYKTDLGTFDLTNIRLLRENMVKYGINPMDLAFVVGVKGYNKLLSLTEVKTVDKYGDKATVLNGELAKLDGIPIIVSEWIRENLNASGVYDGITTDNTVMHLVHRGAYGIGDRRSQSIQILRELYAESGQDAVITKEKIDFKPLYPIATEKTTWMGYNIAV